MPLTQETIAGLKETHPGVEIQKISTPNPDGGDAPPIEIAVKPPSDAAWKRSRAMALDPDPAQKAASSRAIVNDCVVHPTGAELADIIKRYPAIVDVWAGEIAEMAGAVKGSVRTKL